MKKIKLLKYKSYKFIVRIKLIFRKMSRRLKHTITALLALSVFLIPFQNCGQKMQSASDSAEVTASSQDPQTSRVISGRCSTILNKCVAGNFVDSTDSATQNKWSCQGSNGGSTISCATNKPPAAVNGVCSSALNQCSSGSFLDEADSATQNKWSCQGSNGGSTISCATNKPPAAVNGVCSSALNQCTSGIFLDEADSATQNKWSCQGSNGGSTISCATNKPPAAVNGVCSSALNQCTSGSFLDEADSATQNKWSCQGSNGGSTISCATNKPPAAVNGVCSSALNQCSSGNFLDTADTDLENKWSCEGANGGTTMLCSVTKPPTAPPPLPIVQAPAGTTLYDFAHDLKYPGVNGDVTFDFYHPKDYLTKQNLPVFIWVHGGGWSGGDKADDRALAVKIAERGFIVLNVNYTLAPAQPAPYPQPYIAPTPYTIGVRDIMAAVALVKSAAADFHIDLQKISIGGGSAGGHLALMTAASGSTTFNCVISAAGPTDLVLATQAAQFPATVWIAKSIYGDNQAVLRTHSPLHQANSIQARRVYLLHQEKDNLVPIDHARNFLTAARPRFQSALETTFLNDPLPAGTPYEYSPPDKLTHNFDLPQVINAVGNFLSNKCY